MTINMAQIYAKLEAWRGERKITAESQKDGYIINIMEEFGEMSKAIRDYAKFSQPDCHYSKEYKQVCEHEIIHALCNISVFTINAGVHIPCGLKRTEIEFKKYSFKADYILKQMVEKCAEFSYFEWVDVLAFNIILVNCAYLCGHYGFNFEIAMLETIKEISSRTGSYNEATKKWEKDTSDEARKKWYSANYELARIEK